MAPEHFLRRQPLMTFWARRFLRLMSYSFVSISLFFGSVLAQTDGIIPKADEQPGVDLFALMSGTCTILNVAGHDFGCKAVGFFHTVRGRSTFSVAINDPDDESHVVSFSGESGRRSQQNVFELQVDKVLIATNRSPKVDGLPVPGVDLSAGVCRQMGNFAALQVGSVACSAKSDAGKLYELLFVSDGTPIALRRVRLTPPNISSDPYR